MTDSVFFVLCAYFDGSMVFFDEFFPYKSWNPVDIMKEQNMNWFDTTLIVVVYYSYTNGAYEFSVKFCIVKFSSFG